MTMSLRQMLMISAALWLGLVDAGMCIFCIVRML